MKMAFENIIDKTFPGWNLKEIGEKKFDDIFQVEGTPLWWFYSRFITVHVLPKQFNLQQKMVLQKDFFLPKIYYACLSLVFRKYFYYNERTKQAWSLKKNSAGKKVLFLTYLNHYDHKTGKIYRIQKMIDILNKDNKIAPLVLYTDLLSRKASLNLKRFYTIYGAVDRNDLDAARINAEMLSRQWKKLNKEMLFGKGWSPIRPVMDFFFSFESMYNLFVYYQTCKRIIAEQEIKAIVLTSRNGFFEKCMIAAAQQTKTPLIISQHGLGLGAFDPETPPGVKHVVFSALFKQRLLELGVLEEDIAVTGPLIFDDIVPFMKCQSAKKRKIVLITEPFVEENRFTKETYFRLIGNLLGALQGKYSELVIKLHPREKTKRDYELLIERKKVPNVAVVDTIGGSCLYSILSDASLVINFLSTVALEAMIMDKPILTIDPCFGTAPKPEDSPYVGGVMVNIDGDILKAVAEALEDNADWKRKRKEVVSKFCHKVDGKANERAVKVVYGLIRW